MQTINKFTPKQLAQMEALCANLTLPVKDGQNGGPKQALYEKLKDPEFRKGYMKRAIAKATPNPV